jgi:hypothetical protein
MRFITDEILSAAVAEITEPIFDSHAIIRRIMTNEPQAYVRELYERVNKADPIRQTHGEIGRRLTKLAAIRKVLRHETRNVRSEDHAETMNQFWAKVSTPALIRN